MEDYIRMPMRIIGVGGGSYGISIPSYCADYLEIKATDFIQITFEVNDNKYIFTKKVILGGQRENNKYQKFVIIPKWFVEKIRTYKGKLFMIELRKVDL